MNFLIAFFIFSYLKSLIGSDINLNILSNSQKPINPTVLTGMYDTTKTLAQFHGRQVNVPSKIPNQYAYINVLGDSSEEKRIEVDLTNQMLYAYEGETQVFGFPVSTGKWGATPTGEFRIWTKLRYTLMTGGSQALGTYYYLPNVPFTMFFYNEDVSKSKGFSIHGTYWHSNFGHPMSHGCVNMKTEEVEKLFYWADPVMEEGKWGVNATNDNPGTKIIIYGETPNE